MIKLLICLFLVTLSFSQFYELSRKGQEIVVAGRLFNIGAPVVTWMDEYGYDAYRVECRFNAFENSTYERCAKGQSPNRYNMRPPQNITVREKVRGGGWTLDLLRPIVNKVVVHYDVAGYSKLCYKVLHDLRFLSCHFMLDVDGTLYQTLDLKERAWHAGIANSNSVGIEIANIGAYRVNGQNPFARYYTRDQQGTKLVLPRDADLRRPGTYRPMRDQPITGTIQGTNLQQYDLTKEQYDTLTKLIAGLVKIFPEIKLDYPKRNGQLIRNKLPDEEFQKFKGVIGHFHVTTDKIDPGPAFNWELVMNRTKEILEKQ